MTPQTTARDRRRFFLIGTVAFTATALLIFLEHAQGFGLTV